MIAVAETGRTRLVAGAAALLACLIAGPALANGGCGQCDFLITGRDGDDYTATRGNTVCVDESATFTGSITLKGGTFENCGAAIPSSVSFSAPTGGTIVNHGTLRYFFLTVDRGAVENHHVLVAYNDLAVTPEARLVNHGNGFVGVAGELRNQGEVENAGTLDVAGQFRNHGSFYNGGLVNAHRAFRNEGDFTNRGRVNAHDLFHNAEGRTFRSEGGTVAAYDLVNDGRLEGDTGAACNSFLVAHRSRKPGKGELVGSLDFCDALGEGPPLPGRRDPAARISHCGCFNP